MAIGVTKVNGSTQSFGAVGRRLAVTKFAKTNMTQAELTEVVAFIQLTASVIAIGGEETGATAFVSGTTDNVHILTEGPAPVAGADFGGVTGVTASVVSLFDQR
jgi:hypothetical protein